MNNRCVLRLDFYVLPEYEPNFLFNFSGRQGDSNSKYAMREFKSLGFRSVTIVWVVPNEVASIT